MNRQMQECGSTYLIVLLVLAGLSLLGLALQAITQTEILLGGNERIAHKVLYAADTGVGVATARALVAADYSAQELVLPDPETPSALGIEHRVAVSRFHPILDAPCNLCMINQGNDFYEINHAVTATATRTATTAGTTSELARKTLSVMIELQPWRQSPEALFLEDPSELDEIKF